MLQTAEQLARCTGATMLRAAMWLDPLLNAMPIFGITTDDRVVAFLANVGHESGRLNFTREIWNPAQVPAQSRYEPPSDLARRLGNTQPGDGKRFLGRGLIQLTGRANAADAREKMRQFLPNVPDFEAQPEQLETPAWAAYSAAWFFGSHGCNELADAGDFDGVCDLINRGRKTVQVGDSNGYLDRLQFWIAGRKALGLPT